MWCINNGKIIGNHIFPLFFTYTSEQPFEVCDVYIRDSFSPEDAKTHILKIFVHDANFCIYSNSDYSNHLNLHIGVTTSSAAIVEFDRLGLRRHSVSSKAMKNQWAQSLLVEKVPEAWTEHWDDVLQVICKEPVWTPQDYHEDRHNCYTFVLRFLKELAYGELSQAAQSR